MDVDQPAIDRLIEDGLTLYGQGDLDGALMLWERVLAADPANQQANSYVDYVRTNYDVLTSEAEDAPTMAPFAIASDNEPEYIIEIVPGELVPAPASQSMFSGCASSQLRIFFRDWSKIRM